MCDLMYRARVKELLAVDTAVVSMPHSKPQEEEEEGYYSTYTHFGIHEEMLRVCTAAHNPFPHAQEFLCGIGQNKDGDISRIYSPK